MTGGFDQQWYGVRILRRHVANVADKAAVVNVCASDARADTDNVIGRRDSGAGTVADRDIVAAVVLFTSALTPLARIVAARGVARERTKTVGRVAVAGGVEKERMTDKWRVAT